MEKRITKYGKYTVIEINRPNEEEVDRMIERINKKFELRYGKVKEAKNES